MTKRKETNAPDVLAVGDGSAIEINLGTADHAAIFDRVAKAARRGGALDNELRITLHYASLAVRTLDRMRSRIAKQNASLKKINESKRITAEERECVLALFTLMDSEGKFTPNRIYEAIEAETGIIKRRVRTIVEQAHPR